MKILKFVSSLVPTLDKSQIQEDLKILGKELNNTTLQSYEASLELLADRKFKSKPITEFDKLFTRQTTLGHRGNHVVQITHTLRELQDTVSVLERMVDKYFASSTAREGMTYLRGQMIQFISAASFVVRYSRKHLLYLYICENNREDNRTHAMGKEMSKPELEWLETERRNFFDAINAISGNSRKIERAFKEIPDATVNEERDAALQANVGVSKIDPFKLGLIPVVMNPIYHIGVAVAEWQHARYRAAQEELKALEYRIIELRNLEEGKNDAKLQQYIEYTEERARKLNYEIARMEEDYG